jgi:AcrR family transcriptional regulator
VGHGGGTLRAGAEVDSVYSLVDTVYVGDVAAEHTRERLVRAARAHLDERGLEGLSLRGIARRAGVSHGAPLRHFAGVAHLLAAVAAEGFRELHRSVEGSAGEPGVVPARERLRGAGRGYVRFATANPGAFELMFRHERHAAADPELAAAGAAAFLQLVTLITDAQADGWRQGDEPGELAAVVWSVVHGVASLWIPGTMRAAVGLTGVDADLDHIVDLAVDAVITGAPPDPSRRTSR